jgi:signal transduction histidine kinase
VLRFATAGGYFFAVTGPGGNVLQGSESVQEIEFPSLEELENKAAGGPAYLDARTADGEDLRLYVQPATGIRGQTFYFQVGRSIEPEQAALRRLFLITGAAGLAGLALAIAGGYWLAGRALQPIQKSVNAQHTFVADASHELRTPLSLIRANAEMLKRGGSSPPDPSFVDDIITETDRLAYLVGQMLTLARSDAAAVKLDLERLDLGAVATDITRQMRLLADEKHISVNTQVDGETIVQGDQQRLGELAIILLDNAIKYTDEGGSVTVRTETQDGRAVLTVTDTGRGIPEEALRHVFDRFYRADKARSREMGGTGLGLAIARWIAEAHGGAIKIDSAVDRGTTVTVTLPTA